MAPPHIPKETLEQLLKRADDACRVARELKETVKRVLGKVHEAEPDRTPQPSERRRHSR